MVRRFEQNVHCPHCGAWHTVETALERWIRGKNELDSNKWGIVRFDCDILLHRYKFIVDKKGSRDIQCMMLVEAKTHGADVNKAQRDTLSAFSQILRNRRRNIHQKRLGRHAADHVPLARVHSHMIGQDVCLRLFGAHLLQMSGDSPEDSEWMKWDYKPITEKQLIALLRFELDPDGLQQIDWRRRYSDFKSLSEQPRLFP